MKKFFAKIASVLLAGCAAVGKLFAPYEAIVVPRGVPSGFRLKQGGFILLGNRGYAGYAPNTVVELSASTEAALVASGQATVSAGPATAGNVSTTAVQGSCTIAAAGISVTVTNPNISAQTVVYAVIAQAAADTTAFNVARVLCANGSFTIYLNAASTAAVQVDWAILNPAGTFSNPQ